MPSGRCDLFWPVASLSICCVRIVQPGQSGPPGAVQAGAATRLTVRLPTRSVCSSSRICARCHARRMCAELLRGIWSFACGRYVIPLESVRTTDTALQSQFVGRHSRESLCALHHRPPASCFRTYVPFYSRAPVLLQLCGATAHRRARPFPHPGVDTRHWTRRSIR